MISSLFMNQCRREWLLQWRSPRNLLFSGLFFAMITVFFPFTLAPDPHLLRQVAPGIFWIALLLTFLMAAERLFQTDYDEGVIEQWFVSGVSIPLLVLAKVSIQWLFNVAPIVLLCPIIGALFDLSWFERSVLMASVLFGTPAVFLLCALAAAFCTSMQQKGVLMALGLLPLVVPVMIFASGALSAAMMGMPASGFLAILLAFSLLAVTFLPFAIAAILRISLVEG